MSQVKARGNIVVRFKANLLRHSSDRMRIVNTCGVLPFICSQYLSTVEGIICHQRNVLSYIYIWNEWSHFWHVRLSPKLLTKNLHIDMISCIEYMDYRPQNYNSYFSWGCTQSWIRVPVEVGCIALRIMLSTVNGQVQHNCIYPEKDTLIERSRRI